jgi:cytochrome c biogenesis protein CcmG/thiol:disulfide interchange protein DsbE
MNRKLLFLVPLVAFVVLAAFLLRGLWLNPREVPSPLIGKPAPQFERPKLAAPGETFTSREMLGQVWILNVWASWCAPCREEHPLWNEFARKKQATLIGLNYKDQDASASKWLRDLGNPYTVSVADADGRVGIDFGVYGVPETFVIDRAGVIRFKHIGPITAAVLEQKIVPLLQELARS